MSCDTQLNCRTLFTEATALLPSSFFGFLFACSSTFQFLAPNWASPFGKMPILTKRFGAKTFQTSLHGCRANFSDWLLPLTFLFLDTLLPNVFEDCGSEGGSAFRVGFARYLLSCQNHRRRIPRYPHGLQLGRVKFFLADHMHTRATNSPSSGYFFYVTGNTHSSEAKRM